MEPTTHSPYSFSRRRFIRTVGVGTAGVAIFGVAACTSDTGAATTSLLSTSTAPAASTTATEVTTTGAAITDRVSSKRVKLGNVSAYVVERGDGLVVIDTGGQGSAPAIEAALSEYGKTWQDVGYVIATHNHPDHIGSWAAVVDAATDADIFAGGLDIPSIGSGRQITPIVDGDMLNGVRVIATPGHTKGHISMLDPDVGLFTGDALNGSGGGVIGPNPQYTPDMVSAIDSVDRLASFDYEAAFFGHGEPVLTGAAAAVRDLAVSL